MAEGDLSETGTFCDQAQRLALALDAIEQRLDSLGPSSGPDAIAAALAGPVKAFDLAAKEP